jgi:hypothetical protein
MESFTATHRAHIEHLYLSKKKRKLFQFSWHGSLQQLRYLCTHVDTRVWQELEYRIDVCRIIHAEHIENF